ncbi:MAG TPA: hypothetical protein VFW23_02985 [Tepidisphaeraceae bacterium]|nr:hypothetical protein [Tepidisphaeraceae bacterium]
MPHELAFADAAQPARRFILGLALRPYTLGHEIILTARRNALQFANFHELPDAEKFRALALAVDVCSQSWSENNFAPRQGMALTHYWERWKSRRVWRKWRRYLDGLTEAQWKQAVADFLEYRSKGCAVAKVYPGDGPAGRELGAPVQAALLQFLVVKLRKSEIEAYDYPVGLAKFHYYTDAEARGMVKFINQAEEDFQRYCEEEDAKAAKNLQTGPAKAGTPNSEPIDNAS